jgi:thiol-disulfide isomerase/thioredoxin
MNRLKGILILCGGLLVGLIIGGIFLYTNPLGPTAKHRPDPPSTGVQMADFEAGTLGGTTVKLSSLKGTPLVLNFWATWCPPCRQEMPMLQEFSSRYKGKVAFVGVNYAEDPVIVQKFVTALKITFPIWLDRNGDISNLYYVQDYPYTFFIDSDGILRSLHIGQLNQDLLIKYLGTIGVTQ